MQKHGLSHQLTPQRHIENSENKKWRLQFCSISPKCRLQLVLFLVCGFISVVYTALNKLLARFYRETDRQTERRTACRSNTALCVASRGKKRCDLVHVLTVIISLQAKVVTAFSA